VLNQAQLSAAPSSS
jgi:hypothetical protein